MTDLLNRILRHQIGLERAKAGESKKVLKLLRSNDKRIIALIHTLPENYTQVQLRKVLKQIKEINKIFYGTQIKTEMERIAKETVKLEIAFSVKNVDVYLNPNGESIKFPTEKEVLAIGNSRKYQGKTLRKWTSELSNDKTNRLIKNIKLGALEDKKPSQLATAAKRSIKIANQNASTITKIHVNQFSNISRDEVYGKNDDKVKEIIWSSILDSGTTLTCGVRSNKRYDPKTKKPIGHSNDWGGGPGAIHFKCRSFEVPTGEDGVITSGPGEGLKYNEGTRTAIGGGEDYERGDNERVDGKRAKLPNKNNELEKQLLPATTDYESWLRTQPREFVEDSIGVGKAGAFLDDKISLQSFVVEDGRELTLSQINSI